MSQIADHTGDFPRREARKFLAAEANRAAIGHFAEKYAPEGGFAAGDRASHADDVAGMRCQRKAGENRCVSIGEGQIVERHVGRLRDAEVVQRFRRLHQRLDALPRHFRFLHGVEQFCHLGGLHRQLREAG